MIKHLNNLFQRIFSNEETVIFLLAIIFTLVIFSFFASVLTPFIISIVVAYLLAGLQKKIETYNVSESLALILSFSVFLFKLAGIKNRIIASVIATVPSFKLYGWSNKFDQPYKVKLPKRISDRNNHNKTNTIKSAKTTFSAQDIGPS